MTSFGGQRLKDWSSTKKGPLLSYEVIDEIDSFFAGSNAGLNVEVIFGRSEQAG